MTNYFEIPDLDVEANVIVWIKMLTKIASIKKEMEALKSKVYKSNSNKITVGSPDSYDFTVMAIDKINERRREKKLTAMAEEIKSIEGNFVCVLLDDMIGKEHVFE